MTGRITGTSVNWGCLIRPIIPCRTRRARHRTAARCGCSSASTTVSAAASIRSSACVRRTGVVRTYREVVVMWA